MSAQRFALSFFFKIPAATEIYTLSLHDALPILPAPRRPASASRWRWRASRWRSTSLPARSEEHTSELQSRGHLVCRLLLEKKKINVSVDVINEHDNFFRPTVYHMSEAVANDVPY